LAEKKPEERREEKRRGVGLTIVLGLPEDVVRPVPKVKIRRVVVPAVVARAPPEEVVKPELVEKKPEVAERKPAIPVSVDEMRRLAEELKSVAEQMRQPALIKEIERFLGKVGTAPPEQLYEEFRKLVPFVARVIRGIFAGFEKTDIGRAVPKAVIDRLVSLSEQAMSYAQGGEYGKAVEALKELASEYEKVYREASEKLLSAYRSYIPKIESVLRLVEPYAPDVVASVRDQLSKLKQAKDLRDAKRFLRSAIDRLFYALNIIAQKVATKIGPVPQMRGDLMRLLEDRRRLEETYRAYTWDRVSLDELLSTMREFAERWSPLFAAVYA